MQRGRAAAPLPRWRGISPFKTVVALRRAPVGPVLSRTLANWAARQGQGRAGLAFTSETGTPLSHRNVYNRGFVPLLLPLGLTDARSRPKLTPHSLRHFAVSLWIAQGADTKQVAQWVGHESAALCWTHATRRGRTGIRCIGQ